ncbi:hypothetical protein Fmac_008137 [Flemingia macrophylla]|uniref:Uncharacterized protein n=1 Tax=Flemingia macrophylla TaxID=520843 RepID=A0ABD1MWJ3_9FABA
MTDAWLDDPLADWLKDATTTLHRKTTDTVGVQRNSRRKLPGEGPEGSPAKSTPMKFHDHRSFHHWKYARPERFEEEGEVNKLLPFGLGRKDCPRENLTQHTFKKPKRHVSTMTRPYLGLRHGTIDDLAHLASAPTPLRGPRPIQFVTTLQFCVLAIDILHDDTSCKFSLVKIPSSIRTFHGFHIGEKSLRGKTPRFTRHGSIGGAFKDLYSSHLLLLLPKLSGLIYIKPNFIELLSLCFKIVVHQVICLDPL